MYSERKWKNKRFYFIGIGGVSMSALAKYLLSCGCEVSGSDACAGERTEELLSLGVPVSIAPEAPGPRLRTADEVVYTGAVKEEDAELAAARKWGKVIRRRSELLGEICGDFRHVVAVAGSHGKTTCTAMCAHVLRSAGVPFAAHIGGEDRDFGNFCMTGRDFFVTEACEYQKNISDVTADRAILLNVDCDHMECYKDRADLVATFRAYCDRAEAAFACADDAGCRETGDYITFGIDSPDADYRAADLRRSGEKYSFSVEEYGKPLCRVKLNAVGRYNVYNALAAFAAMRSYGFGEREIADGLEEFSAVRRRFERVGNFGGAAVICDYAHHPREIAATVATAERICRGRLYTVFQPHTYSRTKLLMPEFVKVLRGVKNLMIYKTYPAREYYDEEGSARTLAANVGNCLYAESLRELRAWLKNSLRQGDAVLFLGAGDIYYAAKYLIGEQNK